MNKILWCIGLIACVSVLASCCATPVVVEDGVRSRVFIPCTQDNLCFRNTYGVTRDNSCNSDYPVAHRNNDSVYDSTRYEWIYQPRAISNRPTDLIYR